MAERILVDHNTSQNLTQQDPASTSKPNSYRDLTFRPKDMSTDSIEEHPSDDEMEEKTESSAATPLPNVHRPTSTTEVVMRREVFSRMVRDIIEDLGAEHTFEQQALDELQKAAEDHLVATFSNANIKAVEDNRETLQSRDMEFARGLMKNAGR
ncbi:hypothetical protein BKA64DRAFT_713869 [Cadophora sp. MPI-SDFR-AT-0126]|nr:hypothetical protein BKA64DRAFT_713869 [Leotiomycetes sp. MPI-SDFR-AT-0126]